MRREKHKQQTSGVLLIKQRLKKLSYLESFLLYLGEKIKTAHILSILSSFRMIRLMYNQV